MSFSPNGPRVPVGPAASRGKSTPTPIPSTSSTREARQNTPANPSATSGVRATSRYDVHQPYWNTSFKGQTSVGASSTDEASGGVLSSSLGTARSAAPLRESALKRSIQPESDDEDMYQNDNPPRTSHSTSSANLPPAHSAATPSRPQRATRSPSVSSASSSSDTSAPSAFYSTGEADVAPSGPPASAPREHPESSRTQPGPSRTFPPRPPPRHIPRDLVYAINGMYRILDLVIEQGSGGLVDKIIIDQAFFEQLVNDIAPGAYCSLTKVDFAALDKHRVRPVGIYGSQTEIVRFLLSLGVIDDQIAALLRRSCDHPSDHNQPRLRSGLYLLRMTGSGNENAAYAIYWPQDTTWNDDCISSVQRSRVTFMRYLTKITHQVVALVSPEYAGRIVWNQRQDDAPMEKGDSDDDDEEDEISDRLFMFEVAKTKEESENVRARPGFTLIHDRIALPPGNDDTAIAENALTPRLLAGETQVAVLTPAYIPPTQESTPHNEDYFPDRLRILLESGSLVLNPRLSHTALNTLLENGLSRRMPTEAARLRDTYQRIEVEEKRKIDGQYKQLRQETDVMGKLLSDSVEIYLTERISTRFPTLGLTAEGVSQAGAADADGTSGMPHPRDFLRGLMDMYPQIRTIMSESIATEKKFSTISGKPFKRLKEKLLMVSHFLADPTAERNERGLEAIVNSILESHDDDYRSTSRLLDADTKGSTMSYFSSFVPGPVFSRWGGRSQSEDKISRLRATASTFSDVDFLQKVTVLVDQQPLLIEYATKASQIAREQLQSVIAAKVAPITSRIRSLQDDEMKKKLVSEHRIIRENLMADAREAFIRETAPILATSKSEITTINDVERSHSWARSLRVIGLKQWKKDPFIEYQVDALVLTEHDKQRLQLDPHFVPTPRINTSLSERFRLSTTKSIRHIQILPNGKCFLAITDQKGDLLVFLESLRDMTQALQRGACKKQIRCDKLGDQVLLAYDETKRMLAVCVSSRTELKLHTFVFDEHYGNLSGTGSPVNLVTWYETSPIITHLVIPCGLTEEVILVDEGVHGTRARIFSLITQQFRPSHVTFPETPTAVYASPDGACLISVAVVDGASILRAYHWSNFGSSDGILIQLDGLPLTSTTMCSLAGRSSIHFVSLDYHRHHCRSVALEITRKSTEFSFQETSGRRSTQETVGVTAHNCLIDCHAEVWTRFPVVPAIRRKTVHTSAGLQPRALVLVTSRDHSLFNSYWTNLIATFEKNTRKPTEQELSSIRAWATSFASFRTELAPSVSSFLVGEWLVDILCLIPIHIAVTRDNRFVPLKDGVLSSESERSLLGAKVEEIVDAISLGWYESIFSSYMSSKCVKVVSSMGEQSVGKSFALNHLVDTSFAGSAMRTTEGVWLSVNPTEDALIVALDFEGVHSIERSAQEDTLLVLFNTAISNLVLFRNNFALSRDIAGLFQSFQSSSTVLDPAANPTLFKSTLVIIIKDVVESDTKEITKEFSLKFSAIVQQEQAANFISRLHDGKMNIIPWPVIESKEFYTMFPVVKKRLDKQKVTHPRAGVFLQTLKTLMAKLKANDWGALSQNLAAHRCQQILTTLPMALAFGATEIDPEVEPLRDLDTNGIIELNDTVSQFYFPDLRLPPERALPKQQILRNLMHSWPGFGQRHDQPDEDWTKNLDSFLDDLAQRRIDTVLEWISTNTSRFDDNTASIDPLKREFGKLAGDLKTTLQLCKMKCAGCHLLCLEARHHEGNHDCLTDHMCPHPCHYEHDASNDPRCGLPSGHPGIHICDVGEHLCGEICQLSDKAGCMGSCTKPAKHDQDTDDQDHMCQARFHECGLPCSLSGVRTTNGTDFSCPEPCIIPITTSHDTHSCGTRSCSLPCQLCGRLCSDEDHLHGLDEDATHLCGQSHPCPRQCEAQGICHIETAPQSVEVTFTGRHEVFQYTKYSQVNKRLACIISIPAGEIDHAGAHVHSTDPKIFHFCEVRCENCGYYCTLPRGHAQQEHETSHGSMSRTRWAIDGPDGTTVELNGRKFGSSDEGAPMLCSMVCRSLGRHAHLDYCRSADPVNCSGANLEHCTTTIVPHPRRPKDWISHALYWQRSGFRDPYSQEEQATFAKCDSMCSGPEHQPDAQGHAQPSHCTLPLFHPPHPTDRVPPGGGYVSNDGHLFSCRNPFVMQQAFHVIFVIDRSGSMGDTDHRPLQGTPVTAKIAARADNRVGAVYSALYAFWSARHAAVAQAGAAAVRRDAYSIALFDHEIMTILENDYARTPDQLLDAVLVAQARGGTNYTLALNKAKALMESHWSTDRSPVVIFLSDGECSVDDAIVQDLCRRAVALGRALSFHSVAFGPDNAILRRMAQLATDIQDRAPPNPLHPAVPSSYTEALDTIRLAETFLGIADSLRKPRGSLVRA